jgi:hypothetical protein
MTRARSLSESRKHFLTKRTALHSYSTLAGRHHLPWLRQSSRGGAEEPTAFVRMPRLSPANLDHGGHDDASFQIAVVLGRASHGDAFQRHGRKETIRRAALPQDPWQERNGTMLCPSISQDHASYRMRSLQIDKPESTGKAPNVDAAYLVSAKVSAPTKTYRPTIH